MAKDLSEAERTVLNTLVAQTNGPQGEWTSRRSLYVGIVAHGKLSPDQAEAAISSLIDREYIVAKDDKYSTADAVDREPHPGEIQRDS